METSMLAEFLLVSGYAFWIILAVLLVISGGLSALDDDSPRGVAVFVAGAAFLGTVLFTDAFAGFRLATLIIGVAVYLASGVMWSAYKWYRFLLAKKVTIKTDWDNRGDKYKDQTWFQFSEIRRPKASDNKQKLVTWMTLWPYSFSWWVLTWPRRAFSWLYERVSTVFDRISARVFAS